MTDETTPQDSAAMSPASTGSIAKDHYCQCARCGQLIAEDRAWMIEKMKRREWLSNVRWDMAVKARERATFWHGKWAIVCAENNALRKRIRELGSK